MQSLPTGVRTETGAGNLDRLVVATAKAEAHVYLHGAQVTHFQPKGARPVLWVSRQSHFEDGVPGKAIRGGIPICFPWSGPKASAPTAPMHGVARLLTWQLGEVADDGHGAVQANLHLRSNEYTRGLFPYDFSASLVVTIDERLKVDLFVRNTGAAPMPFEEALHSYFAVGDVRRIALHGLEGARYFDRAGGGNRPAVENGPMSIDRETNRLYPQARGTVLVEDPVWQRRIRVGKAGSSTTVVWNPWVGAAKALADFGDDEWPQMVCVEVANAAEHFATLAPGATHVLTTTIDVEPTG